MNDLIERLQAMAGSDMVPMEKAMNLLLEAANALEALRELAESRHDEMERLRDGWHMANGTAELAMKHRDAAEARAERLAEALQWYVDNDDTNDGQEGNEFWLAGRDRARALLREQEKQ